MDVVEVVEVVVVEDVVEVDVVEVVVEVVEVVVVVEVVDVVEVEDVTVPAVDCFVDFAVDCCVVETVIKGAVAVSVVDGGLVMGASGVDRQKFAYELFLKRALSEFNIDSVKLIKQRSVVFFGTRKPPMYLGRFETSVIHFRSPPPTVSHLIG